MLKQNVKAIANRRFLSLLLVLLTVAACIVPAGLPAFADESTQPVKIITSPLGDNVSIHSELQAQYLNGSMQDIANYADGTEELSRPANITLTWHTEIDEAYAAEKNLSAEGCTYRLYFGTAARFPPSAPNIRNL